MVCGFGVWGWLLSRVGVWLGLRVWACLGFRSVRFGVGGSLGLALVGVRLGFRIWLGGSGFRMRF